MELGDVPVLPHGCAAALESVRLLPVNCASWQLSAYPKLVVRVIASAPLTFPDLPMFQLWNLLAQFSERVPLRIET